MAFKFTNRNIVVAGEFNRAIIRPAWLVNQGIVPPGEGEMLLSDRPDAPALFKISGYQWEVALHRLLVRPLDDPDQDPGQIIARILEVLPHTPTTAVGHNFLFESPDEAPLEVGLGDLHASSLVPMLGTDVIRTEASFSLRIADHDRLAAKIVKEGGSEKIDINFHLATADNASAIASIRRGPEFRSKANDVVRILSGVKK